MNRKTLLATVALAALLSLTGCGSFPAAPRPTPTPENARDEGQGWESVVHPYVDGTELTCIRDVDYGSVSCNWEAWNQARAKK